MKNYKGYLDENGYPRVMTENPTILKFEKAATLGELAANDYIVEFNFIISMDNEGNPILTNGLYNVTFNDKYNMIAVKRGDKMVRVEYMGYFDVYEFYKAILEDMDENSNQEF